MKLEGIRKKLKSGDLQRAADMAGASVSTASLAINGKRSSNTSRAEKGRHVIKALEAIIESREQAASMFKKSVKNELSTQNSDSNGKIKSK